MTTKPAPAEAEQLTVGQALAELHKMIPKAWCYIEIIVTGDCNPNGKQDTGNSVWIQIDSKQGDILYNKTASTLTEAMDQVRKWHKEQQ